MVAVYFFTKPEEKAQKEEAYRTGVVVNFAKMIENILTISGGKFITGQKVTIADFILAAYINNMIENTMNPLHATFQNGIGPKFRAYIAVNKQEFKAWNSKREPKMMWVVRSSTVSCKDTLFALCKKY